jgi:uncharacterized membrane protein
MKIIKLFQYAYIILAGLFLWDAISKWSEDRNGAYMSLFFAAFVIFIFFFRKRFSKRFEDQNKK